MSAANAVHPKSEIHHPPCSRIERDLLGERAVPPDAAKVEAIDQLVSPEAVYRLAMPSTENPA